MGCYQFGNLGVFFYLATWVYMQVIESTTSCTLCSMVLIGPYSAIKAKAFVIIMALPRLVAKLRKYKHTF